MPIAFFSLKNFYIPKKCITFAAEIKKKTNENMSKIVTDYQIGDFVEYEGNIYEVEGRVGGLGLNLCDYENKVEHNDVYVGDVHPIPVTTELLEKMGLHYSDFFGYYVYTGLQYSLSYNQGTKTFALHSRQVDTILNDAVYVHQLQQVARPGYFDDMIMKDYLTNADSNEKN